ncbi:MAG: dihydrofolate reductase family protein, partial [Candidatus Limnocylindrales bacterium]
ATWGTRIGAEIMGRHKFDPSDGPWPDDGWIGWWGVNPPFHTPCYVLTHYPHPSIELEEGNTFHFIEGTPAEVVARVRADIGDELDIRLGGGVATIREFVRAGVVDWLHLLVVPIVLGRGERIWDGLEGLQADYDVESVSTPSGITHVTFTKHA